MPRILRYTPPMAQTHTLDPHTVDRVKLPFHYDAGLMRSEVEAMGLHPFIYYSVIMLKLPQERKADDPPTGYPYITKMIEDFNLHTHVSLARILRLEPGAEVQQHCDPMLGLEIPDSVVRLTIPICGGDDVTFYLNDKPVPMKPGECWYMKLSDQHRILHCGARDRVNLTIDVKPNAWVRDLIQKSYESALPS